MFCECKSSCFCVRHKVSKSAEWVALCKSRPDYFNLWEKGIGPGQVTPTRDVQPIKHKMPINCTFLTNSECTLATEIATVRCITNDTICKMCLACDRPSRLNIHTAGLVVANNPNQDMNQLIETILGNHKGFGTTLAKAFAPFFQELPNCQCHGHEDILNIWTKEYITKNLETVIRWLQTEAFRRELPFSPKLCRLFLKGLLAISSS